MPFVRQPNRVAWHWQHIDSGDGKGNHHGFILLLIRFENLKKDRILNSEGIALRKIGDLHVGLPQTKLHLLLPKSKPSAAAAAAVAAKEKEKEHKEDEHKGEHKEQTSATGSTGAIGATGALGTQNPQKTNKRNSTAPATAVLEHRYSVRIHVEGYELSTAPIVVGDMEADGTLSFQSWELHRDGRVRVRLPVAITDPFATITFTIVTIAPDAEEKILGVANTSILRLIEQQSTALLERENQEDRLIQKGALVAATAADEVGSSSSPPSSTATKVPQQHSGIRPSGTSILGISESLKESFQKQVMRVFDFDAIHNYYTPNNFR